MAESEAMIGYGAKFSAETSAGTDSMFDVAEVTSITPPSETVDIIDVTHMGSEDSTREFIQGLMDPGEVSLEMNFVPGSPSDKFIRAWRASRERRKAVITFPNDVTWSFSCFVTGYEPAMPNEDKMTATVTFKVTSSVLADD